MRRGFHFVYCDHDCVHCSHEILLIISRRNPWEGVNILPFIDVNLLRQTIEKHCPDSALTADERHRNRIGKVFCYSYDAAVNDTVPSCNRDIGLPNIVKCNSRVDILENHSEADVSFRPELIPGTQIPYPGFPSLNVLPIEHMELKNSGLNCFGFPSKYPNMILTMHQLPQLPGALQLAENIIGKNIFVNWPMMHEAKVRHACTFHIIHTFSSIIHLLPLAVILVQVVALSDASCEVRMVKKKLTPRNFSPPEVQRWNAVSEMMAEQYLVGAGYPGSGGVSIGDVQIRLKVVPLQGMKTSPVDGSNKKVFGIEEADVPLQMALFRSPAPDPRFIERGPMTLKDRFPPKCRVILTKGKYRGCVGSALGAVDDEKVGVKVEILPPEPPFGLAIARSVQESYITAGDAAKILRMDPRIFGKVTGNLFFSPGRYDLGLNLKYKDKRYVLGYTRVKKDPNSKNKKKDAKAWSAGDTVLVVGSKRMSNADDSGSGEDEKERVMWEFTPKAVRLVAAYKNAYPQLFAALAKAPDERFYSARKVFGPKGDDLLPKVREWLNGVETAKMPRLPDNTEAMPVAAVHAVQRAADVRTATLEKDGAVKESNVRVPASAIYREGSTAATDVLLASEHSVSAPPELGDRVANLCANGVPFGARGTVVAIHDPAEGCVEVVLDEEFIGGSSLQGACANFRGKLCVWNHLLKISAADSKGIVEHVIPTGSGKAAVERLMHDIQEEAKNQEAATVVASSEVPAVNGASSTTPQKQVTAPGSGRDPKNAWGSRPNSTPRGGGSKQKQGAWTQASGPPEKGIGFRVDRGIPNGFQAWRKLVAANGQSSTSNKSKSAANKKVKNGKSNAQSDGLKTMLGVKNDSVPPTQTATQDNNNSADTAEEGLKAILGVVSRGDEPANSPVVNAPPPMESAADALMQLMMQDNQFSAPPPMIPLQTAPRSAFNFTYVKEGEDQPTQEIQQHSMMSHIHPMGMGMPNFFPPQGVPLQMMPPMSYGMGGNPPITNQANPEGGKSKPKTPAKRDPKSGTSTTPGKKPAAIVPSVVVKSKK